ncbi:MAG TPA: hypothetical protein VGB69_01120 [Edaphobacter sp.]
MFSNLVTVVCLLAFFVSSAACLAVELPPQEAAHEISMPMPMHSMSAPDHDCCPHNGSAHQMTSSCCTVHHQPASCVVAAELHEDAAAVFAVFVPPSLSSAALHHAVHARPVPLQEPPLIALRI